MVIKHTAPLLYAGWMEAKRRKKDRTPHPTPTDVRSEIRWTYPPQGSRVINTDGALFASSGKIGTWWVCRDDTGLPTRARLASFHGPQDPGLVEAYSIR